MSAAEVAKLEEAIPDLILNQKPLRRGLSEQAVEITQLALWIRSARRDHKLSDLSQHIVWGNSPRLRHPPWIRRRSTGPRTVSHHLR